MAEERKRPADDDHDLLWQPKNSRSLNRWSIVMGWLILLGALLFWIAGTISD